MDGIQATENSVPQHNSAYRLIQVDGSQDTNTSIDSTINDLWEQDHDFLLNKDWELNYYGAKSPLLPLIQPQKTIVGKFSHFDAHWWEKNSPDNPLNHDPNQETINTQCNFRNLKSSLSTADYLAEAAGSLNLATNTLQDTPKVSNFINPESSNFRCSEDDSNGRG